MVCRTQKTTGFEAHGWPVRLTVFVDNSSGAARSVEHMRDGLRALLQELPDEMEVALLTTAWQARWITRHTSATRSSAKCSCRRWGGTSPASTEW